MHFGVALIAIFGAAQVAALWRFGEAGIDQNGAFRGMPVDYGRAAIGSVATSCFRHARGDRRNAFDDKAFWGLRQQVAG